MVDGWQHIEKFRINGIPRRYWDQTLSFLTYIDSHKSKTPKSPRCWPARVALPVIALGFSRWWSRVRTRLIPLNRNCFMIPVVLRALEPKLKSQVCGCYDNADSKRSVVVALSLPTALIFELEFLFAYFFEVRLHVAEPERTFLL